MLSHTMPESHKWLCHVSPLASPEKVFPQAKILHLQMTPEQELMGKAGSICSTVCLWLQQDISKYLYASQARPLEQHVHFFQANTCISLAPESKCSYITRYLWKFLSCIIYKGQNKTVYFQATHTLTLPFEILMFSLAGNYTWLWTWLLCPQAATASCSLKLLI